MEGQSTSKKRKNSHEITIIVTLSRQQEFSQKSSFLTNITAKGIPIVPTKKSAKASEMM
jgi:hypothetical protein